MLVLNFLAMVLECLMILFVAWLVETEVLLFYLERFRQLDQRVEAERGQNLARLW